MISNVLNLFFFPGRGRVVKNMKTVFFMYVLIIWIRSIEMIRRRLSNEESSTCVNIHLGIIHVQVS